MFTHHELPPNEVQQRQRAQRIDRLAAYLRTDASDDLIDELADATASLDIRLYDEDGQEIA